MHHGAVDWHRGLQVPRGRFQEAGRFARKFPHLRSLRTFEAKDAEELGKFEDGVMREGDIGDAGDNPDIPAGFTFFGQFVDHDITFDPTSHLEQQNDPLAIRNFRTPALELDSLYGAGPGASPFLYDGKKRGYFLFDEGAAFDVPRNSQDVALIGDPRNDENVIVSQLHVTFLKFHNAVMDVVHGSFEEAQTLVRWHYQWIVLNEYLRLICGDDAVKAALARPHNHRPEEEFSMPVEFAVAAFRFGHSQVRSGYRLNGNAGAAIFPDTPDAERPKEGERPTDLRGGARLHPDFRIAWDAFFGDTAQKSRLIDSKLVAALLKLPGSVVSELRNDDPDRSLATRNLKRGIAFALPAGETIAAYYEIEPLSREKLGGIPGGEGGTPLWFYILKEAELRASGRHLHGVGARIVAETFVDMLRMDAASFLASSPDWRPTLPSTTEGDFKMADLTAFASGPDVGV